MTKALWRQYLELCKPRVVSLMLLTALVGMFLATPHLAGFTIMLLAMIGIGFAAGSAATMNHLIDQKIDILMKRTENRPLPTGAIQTHQAILFAVGLGSLGLVILYFWVNPLTAYLSFLTLVGYGVIYTVFLKRATPQNIVIGGLAGAAPPILGWAAVTGSISAAPLLLSLIIFAWTPPHFWALAIHRQKDYAKANIPMLPVTHGIKFTKLCIVLYTFLLFAISLMPFVIDTSGYIYLAGAVALGLVFLYHSFKLYLSHNNHHAMPTFKYSIYYLMLLFVFLLVDHYFLIR